MNVYEHLRLDQPSDGVLLITIDRPAQKNAVNEPLHHELAEIWYDVGRDSDVRVVVITGAGDAFSAGGDMAMIRNQVDNFDATTQAMQDAAAIVRGIIDCPKPIVSAVNGAAVGAGLAIALLADISVVAENAKLGDPHVSFGIAAGDHAAMIWPLLCGLARTKRHVLLGEFLTGREAEEIGLVSIAVPVDDVLPTAQQIAQRLAVGSPSAIRWTKQALNGWLRQAGPTFDASLALEMLGFFGPDVRQRLT